MENSYIGIMADDSPELLMGVLGILKSKNIFVPINPVFPNERINFIIHDCKIRVLLTDNANYEKAQQIAKSHPLLEHLLCIGNASDNNETAESESSRDMISRPMEVVGTCYVIYTSGSTGRPKGVPITHCNLIPLLSWFRDYFGLGIHTRVMQNLSYTFDFGVFELLSTILYGGCLYLSDKRTIGDFSFFSRLINKHFINTVHSTPVFFDNVVSFGEMMHSLQLVHLGGERLTGKIVKDISRVVPGSCKIHNGYGPTEATINCSIFTLTAAHGITIDENAGIPIGRPTAHNFLYILDRYNNPQSVGVAGELCVAGGGTARGYLNRPQLTAEKFDQDFHHSSLIIHHSSLYRTGDLARWLTDGNIEFLGRIDHQVKVRGFRIELGEIEHCLLAHGDIKETVVLAREKEGGSHYLCAYIVPGNSGRSFEHSHPFTVSELREYLLQQLPDYMIPSYFIQLDRMPLTTNGKIDRKVLPEPDESSIAPSVEYAAPVTDTEKKLATIWQELLKIGKIGRMDDFFELGGDSILANQCIARIREAFQVEIPLRKFFEQPYLKSLSWEIGKREQQALSIPKAPRDGEIPLSFAQERLWFLHTLDPESSAYFVPRVIRMTGELDVGLLEQTFTEIVRRHEILRTTFSTQDDHPVQHIHPPYFFKIPVIDWSSEGENRQTREIAQFIKEEGKRLFDFEKGPLLRVTLLRLKKEEHLLILTEHHLIHDGWTQGVLLREFIEIFTAYSEGKEHTLPALSIQYADFAIWQRNYLQGEMLERHLDYWKEKLSGLGPVLELPTDRPRPSVISGEGAMRAFHLPGPLTLQLKDFSRRNGVTLFMTMLAVFKTFLYRYTGVEDLCVGTGIANRRYKEMEGMLGMVINTLPLRTQVAGDMTFDQCLHLAKETCLKAYQHEDTPFGKIVEVMQPKRSLSYMPIFQVMFSFMDTPTQELRLPGMELHLEEFHNRSSKFDINIVVVPPQEQAGNETKEERDTLIEWEYNTDIFDDKTTDRMIKHYTRLLKEIISKSKEKIFALPILEKSEIEQLLFEFNDTRVAYPSDKVIHELFKEQAEKAGDHIALVGVVGQHLTYRPYMTYMTYKELNKKSNRLTHLLMEKGIQPDSIVGIMVERSVEMIIGILGILKAGGTYMPIDPDYPQQRINYMLTDSSARVLVSEVSKVSEVIEVIDLNQLTDSNTQTLFNTPTQQLTDSPTQLSSESTAYIMYTSGSTGHPKGVMVTHRNVIRLVKNTNYVPLTAQTRILQTGAPVFDATTFEIWGSLLNGGQLILTDKEVILDAYRLGEALIAFKVNTLWLSSPLFNRLMQQNIELFAPLNYLLVGGDVLSPANIDRVRQTFPGLKIINGYGPTENTTFSTTYLIDRTFELNIPIGSPINNSTAYIVNKNDHLQPVGVWGELCVGGDGISCGYLNSPEMTAKKFDQDFQDDQDDQDEKEKKKVIHKNPLTSLPLYPSTSLYRTGDLARWIADGDIEFLGRKDFQVKIRGYRVELGEIESQLQKCPLINDAVVIANENANGDKYLCAYFTSGQEVEITDVRTYLDRELPDYMIPTSFMPLDTFPLTVNGKIDRKALPEPEIKKSEEYIAPSGEIEEALAGIWAEVLGIEKDVLGIDANFFEWGGHSLYAARLISEIHKTFNCKVPLRAIFSFPTIRLLAAIIEKSALEQYVPIRPAEEKEYYELSPAQKRLYILQQMEANNISYNIPLMMLLEGDVNRTKPEEALKKLIDRHDSLRTSFITVDDKPMQKVHEEVDFEIEYYELTSTIEHFVRPFDLSQPLLVRAGLIKVEEKKHILVVDMHHIISDGTSAGILATEFMKLCQGETLPPLTLQYKDYVRRYHNERQGEIFKRQAKYWQEQFREEIPVLDLPTDFVRPDIQSFEGRCIPFEITQEETRKLNRLALKEGTTLYMVTLAIFNIFLYRLSSREIIVIGTAAAGRRHTDLKQIIGMFVNTLGLKNHLKTTDTFQTFLKEVSKRTMEAFENQEYPFEELVERVSVGRDTSRNPLFDFMFVLDNMDLSLPEIPGIIVTPYEWENKIAKFDLTLSARETGENLHFVLEYCTRLFKEETIHRFIAIFRRILCTVVEESRTCLSRIDIIGEEEKEQVLHRFNDTDAPYPKNETIHLLFEEQAARTPDTIAVAATQQEGEGTVFITYRELNKKSDQLACVLNEMGISPHSPDRIVGIMVSPSVEMVSGILGILKAGGAWLPISPDTPLERIAYMLSDSNARILLSEVSEMSEINEGITVMDLKIIIEENEISPTRLTQHPHPTQPCYIIYTSGSTGKPKGVVVPHGAFVNRLYALQNRYCFDRQDVVMQKTVNTFDVSVCELFRGLVRGAVVMIPCREIEKDMERLVQTIEHHKVTVIDFVPFMLNLFLDYLESHRTVHKVSSLRLVFTGVETVEVGLVQRFRETLHALYGTTLINAYGPTEATVDVTWYDCTVGEVPDRIPIGAPMDNTRIFILDENSLLRPIGVVGELCISGAGLALGYLNRPELTAETFNRFYKCYRTSVFYKTGDLARWLPDGNIEFMGRKDFQVKIRGFRVELGEIENHLLRYEKVKEAVVIDRRNRNKGGGPKYLCAYIVPLSSPPHPAPDAQEFRAYLKRRLPDYMIPSFFIPLLKIPRTPEGKIDRKLLPEPGEMDEMVITSTTGEHTPPRDAAEAKLVEIWSRILEIKKENIGIDVNFFDLGGHSLNAVMAVPQIHKAFHVKIPLGEFFKRGTVRELTQYIKDAGKEIFIPVVPVEKKEYYPLSPSQERLYLLQQMQPQSPAYNIPERLMMTYDINEKSVEKILKTLVEHHESLRTGIKIIKKTPVQFTAKTCVLPFRFIDISFMEESKKTQKRQELYHQVAAAPFDLETFPLFRSVMVKLGPQQHELLFNLHHIITDGWSMEILKKEFLQLVEDFVTGRAAKLEPVHLQYKDFAGWHCDQLTEKGKGENPASRFWKNKLTGGIPFLRLPADFPAAGDEPGGAGYRCAMNSELKQALRQLAGRHHTSLFTVMFSIYLVLLSRISGQEDVGCSVIAAGRDHEALQDIVGLFVNSLLFRVHMEKNQPFEDFLREVDTDVMESLRYQGYPMEPVFEELGMRYPRVSVSFNMLNLPGAAETGKLNPLEHHHIDVTQDVKFNLEPYITEYKNGIDLRWVYRKSLFKPLTIEYIANLYMELAGFFAQAPCRSLKSFKTGARIVTPGRFKRRKTMEG